MKFDTIKEAGEWIDAMTPRLVSGEVLALLKAHEPVKWLPVGNHRDPWTRLVIIGLDVRVEFYDGARFTYSDLLGVTL